MSPLLSEPSLTRRLLDVADTFGTPTYAYAESVVRDRIAQLRGHLAGVPLQLLYAMKANSNPALLRLIHEEGLGLDVVSPGELLLALEVGFAPSDLLYSANNMTDEEMHLAHERGVLLNIGEVSRLERYGRAYPGSRVCVRLNPRFGAGHHEHVITAGAKSKFGIPVDEADAVRAVAEQHGLRIAGLHHHIGSGILSTEAFWKAAEVLLDAALGFPAIEFVNLGGGLGVPYRPGDVPFDFANFRARVVEPLQAFLERHPAAGLTVCFEPGRFLLAESGALLMQVNTLKEAHGRCFAGTDSGMNHLVRPAMYGAYHAIVNLSNLDGPLRTYDITGNICESGDLFARDRSVQEVREGDVLAVLDAGAYGIAMASEYNLRPLPAEVLLTQEPPAARLIRPRLTPEALVERLLADTQPTAVPGT